MFGGQIDSGVDTNGDGVLDAAEEICEPNTPGDACTLEDIDGVKVLTCGDTSAVVPEEPNRIVASIACIGARRAELQFDYSAAQMAYGDVFASASIETLMVKPAHPLTTRYSSLVLRLLQLSLRLMCSVTQMAWTVSLNRDTPETTVRYDDIDTSGVKLPQWLSSGA